MERNLIVVQSSMLGQAPGVQHGFFTRSGGVSEEEFDSLNCSLSSGDQESSIRENRKRVAEIFGLEPESLLTLTQVHGRKVWQVLSAADVPSEREGDGLVTRQAGVGLGIVTADCAPLLFADTVAGVIGAAHAGWGGALCGVAEAVLAEMRALGARPSRIVAAIGPCIQRDSYQVDDGFYKRFVAQSPFDVEPFFRHRDDGRYFDLPAYVAARLHAAGVARLDRLTVDTYHEEAQFFSYRRSSHRGETRYGRQISVIALTASSTEIRG